MTQVTKSFKPRVIQNTTQPQKIHLPYLAKSGKVLMPKGVLPLYIETPKDIVTVKKALANNQIIGIIQPQSETKTKKRLYQVGCTGRITTYSENTDGSLYIIVQGLKKFKALTVENGLLVVERLLNHDAPVTIPQTDQESVDMDRKAFLSSVTSYLRGEKLLFKIEDLEASSNEALATSLTMACPFAANEKQAILESKCVHQQLSLIKSFVEMRGYDHLSACAYIH